MTNAPNANARPDDENLSPDEFPSVLRITIRSDEDVFDDMQDRMGRWSSGEDVPHVVSFGRVSDLRGLLTDRRVEIIQSVMDDSPASISALAKRLDRDYRTVYEDVELLAEYNIVHYRKGQGRSKRLYVPYERIEFSGVITRGVPA
jgi:predicted transcriptional regulator